MVNKTLIQIDSIISKNYDVIKALDNDYIIQSYTPEVRVERGTYGFNIMPQSTTTRNLSAERDLQDLRIDIYMHYDMEADDEYTISWTEMMSRANVILQALFDKQNFLTGISTVKIDITFDNPIINKERIVDLTFLCEYKIFATR